MSVSLLLLTIYKKKKNVASSINHLKKKKLQLEW